VWWVAVVVRRNIKSLIRGVSARAVLTVDGSDRPAACAVSARRSDAADRARVAYQSMNRQRWRIAIVASVGTTGLRRLSSAGFCSNPRDWPVPYVLDVAARSIRLAWVVRAPSRAIASFYRINTRTPDAAGTQMAFDAGPLPVLWRLAKDVSCS
jgi:hypothetical protein